jgi:hypothetical protein
MTETAVIKVDRRWVCSSLLPVNHNALIPESYGRRGRSRQLLLLLLLLYTVASRLAAPRVFVYK